MTREEIDDNRKYNDMYRGEQVSTNIPGFRIYRGIDVDKNIPYASLAHDKDIIKNYQDVRSPDTDEIIKISDSRLSQFSRKSALLDQYFNDAEANRARLSKKIIKLIYADEKEKTEMLIKQLDEVKTPAEALDLLNGLSAQHKGTKQEELFKVLSKIEAKNLEVVQHYRKLAAEQNPLYSVLENVEVKINNENFSNPFKSRIALSDKNKLNEEELNMTHDEMELYKGDIAKEMKDKMSLGEYRTNLRKLLDQYNGNTPSSKDLEGPIDGEFLRYYSDTYLSDTVDTEEMIQKDIDLIDLQEKQMTLSVRHDSAQRMANIIMVEAFQKSGAGSLEESIFQVDANGNNVTNGAIKVRYDNLRKSLQRAVGQIENDPSYPKELKDYILTDIVDMFATELTDEERAAGTQKAKIHNAFAQIEERYTNRIEAGIPPDARIEQEFQKMLEDTIYNRIMETNGGTKLFKDMGGSVQNEDEGVISISDNAEKGKYRPIGSAGSSTTYLADDAISLHNINAVFEKIENGSISKAEARSVLSDEVKFLDNAEKEWLGKNMEEIFNGIKISLNDLGIKTDHDGNPRDDIDKGTSNFISSFNARKLYNDRFRDSLTDKLLESVHLQRVAKTSLFACLEKSENPMVRNQTTASETSACVDTYKKSLEESLTVAQGALRNPLIVFSGFPLLLVLAIAFKRAHIAGVYRFQIRTELERAKGVAFVEGAKDFVEQKYRDNAIVIGKTNIGEGITDKKNYGQYAYLTIKAQHDYEMNYNPYLEDGETIRTLSESSSVRENAEATRKATKNILGNRIRIFNEGMEAHSSELVKKHHARVNASWKEIDSIMQNTTSPNHEVAQLLAEKQTKYLEVVKEGFEEGGLDVYEAEEKLNKTKEILRNFIGREESAIKEEREKLIQFEQNRDSLEYSDNIEKEKMEINSQIENINILIGDKRRAIEDITAVTENTHSEIQELIGLRKSVESIVYRSHNRSFGGATTGNEISKEEMRKRVTSLLSQSESFGAEGLSAATESFAARYTGLNAERAVFQDMSFLNKMKSEDPEGESKYVAIKTVMLESYIKSKMIEDGGIGRDDVLEGLFRAHPDVFIKNSDIHFATIAQDDGKSVQVIAVKKKNETDSLVTALRVLSGQDKMVVLNSEGKATGYRDPTQEELTRNIAFVKRETGIDPSRYRFTDEINKKPIVAKSMTLAPKRAPVDHDKETLYNKKSVLDSIGKFFKQDQEEGTSTENDMTKEEEIKLSKKIDEVIENDETDTGKGLGLK